MKTSVIRWRTIVLVLAFVVLGMFWLLSARKKEDMHCDEYFSYMGANSEFEEEGYPFNNLKNFENGQWVTPDYFNDLYAVTSDELLDYGTAWNNQKQDVHPPLYYLLLHLITSVRLGRFSMMAGALLNIICMLAALIFLYKIFVILSEDQSMSAIAVLAYGTCPGVVSTIVFLRMYSLLTLFTVIGFYLFVAYENKKIKDKAFLAGVFLINILGMLTQYYFLFIAVGLFLTFVLRSVYLIYRRRRKVSLLSAFVVTNILSAVLYLFFWPDCIQHILFGYRGEETFQNVVETKNFINNTSEMFVHLDQGLFLNSGKLIIIFTCFLILLSYLKSYWDEKDSFIAIIGLNAVFYYLIVSHISEMKTDRYLMPIYPLIAVTVLGCLIKALKRFEKKGLKAFTLLMAVFCVANMLHAPNYLYSGRAEQIESLVSHEQENCMYIHKDYHWYQIMTNSRYFMNYQNTKIIYNMDDPNLILGDERLQSLSSVCVFFDMDYDETGMKEYFGNNLWNGQYTYTYLGNSEYCNIYLFTRNGDSLE